MSDRIVIPEYPIPKALVETLDQEIYFIPSSSHKCGKIIEALKHNKCIDIEEKHYEVLLEFALYLEEYQNNKEMDKYELFEKSIRKIDDPKLDPKLALYHITVDNIDEERPWIKPNDLVDIIDISTHKLYTLQVTNVTKTDIVANDDDKNLSSVYDPNKLYDIKFRFQNYPLRCAHYALRLMSQRRTVPYLFPKKKLFHVETDNYDDSYFQAINPNVSNNPEQKQAVLNIINKSSFPVPYILYGPPGTGKTATLVEAMCQILRNSYDNILVCTPSNTAGDEITKRLLEYVPPQSIYRMYSQSKDGSSIDEQILFCSNVEKQTVILPKYREVMRKRIVISTLCNSTRLIIMKIPSDHFSHVFIDESGQGTEPDILIPISLVSKRGRLYSQIVFAGDPQQLGPTVISKKAESILGRSILERLMSYEIYQKDSNNKYNPKYITKLLQNYRSHPNIIHVSNKLFYDSELVPKFVSDDQKIKFPIIFHGIQGIEQKCPYSTSICNLREVDIVISYVEDLLKNRWGFGYVKPSEIGIVTPYKLQSQKIKKALKDRQIKEINVGTVESYQGQERKIMIMTTVRSQTCYHAGKEDLGFISNFRRFNVSITRAKSLLIVIANPHVLQIDENWRFLLKFCIDNNSYTGISFSLKNFGANAANASTSLVQSSVLFKELQPAYSNHDEAVCHYEDRSYLYSDEEEDIYDLMDDFHIF